MTSKLAVGAKVKHWHSGKLGTVTELSPQPEPAPLHVHVRWDDTQQVDSVPDNQLALVEAPKIERAPART